MPVNWVRLSAEDIKSRGRHHRLHHELAYPEPGVQPGRADKSRGGAEDCPR